MVAPHGQIRVEQVRVEHGRVEHERVHEMINDAFGVQGGMEPEQYFDEAPNEEARRFYDQLEERNRPNRNDEGDIDPLFPRYQFLIKMVEDLKSVKRGFTDMEMQSGDTYFA
ncbi:hypothetical protein H5410_003650 [Solanum commersonii]|uniref:Uncharacterized protein n=1 Tax=Solanum commersonii TaxID=4109 RepID=A0A9J6B588_SOLCO|nr:hypothetical protein H5410_003650 [Solanum commersonii]